jgi:hypothetical protein
MTEENVSGSESVSVPADNISIWCTSSRGTIFIWGADIEQCKISDIIIIIIQLFFIKIPRGHLQISTST